MAGMVALLGVGSIWQGFQSAPPDTWRKYQVAADFLGSIRYGDTMPLFILLGGYLLFEAWRMARFRGRYRRRDERGND